MGWWRNWLAHRTVTAVVAGSSPVHPVFQENFMDYKALLLKYMEYISESEGSDFTGRTLEFSNLFSNDEKTELRSLSKVNSYKDNSKPKIRKK